MVPRLSSHKCLRALSMLESGINIRVIISRHRVICSHKPLFKPEPLATTLHSADKSNNSSRRSVHPGNPSAKSLLLSSESNSRRCARTFKNSRNQTWHLLNMSGMKQDSLGNSLNAPNGTMGYALVCYIEKRSETDTLK